VLERVGLAVPPAPADWVERALDLEGTARDAVLSPRNTTIAAIVTDARLDAAQATRVAQSAQAGLARAIHPSHTLYDGDTVFALATGGAQSDVPSHELVAINAAAADALSLAIVDAVVAADAHPRGARDGAGDGAEDAPAAPRPAALREVAPDLVDAWEALTTAS
jgi:L-aminopeptidase/D-esterase-like protein